MSRSGWKPYACSVTTHSSTTGTSLVPALTTTDCSNSGLVATVSCLAAFADRFNNTLGVPTLATFSTEAGALFLEGMGDGVWLTNDERRMEPSRVSGRTYLEVKDNRQFINNTSFSILQATRTRISKTEYISCPSCGRTLFDLQETTARIRSVTHHLKGVKIAIMGCIVNGPGESKHADIGISLPGTGEAPAAPVFIDGEKAMTLRGENIAQEFHAIVQNYIEKKYAVNA